MKAEELKELMANAKKEKADIDRSTAEAAKAIFSAHVQLKAAHDHLKAASERSVCLNDSLASLSSELVIATGDKETLASYFKTKAATLGYSPLAERLQARQAPPPARQKPYRAYIAYLKPGTNECAFRPFGGSIPFSLAYPSQLETLAVAMFVGFTVASAFTFVRGVFAASTSAAFNGTALSKYWFSRIHSSL